MSRKAYSFPPLPPDRIPRFTFPRFNAPGSDPSHPRHEDYIRERTAQSKYPAAMLAELYAAGEITREQYERLRMERA